MNKLSIVLLIALLAVCSMVTAQDVEVATTIALTEGPTADSDGNLFFTDQANNRIMRLGNDGKLSTFRQPSNYANGMVFDAQWRLLVCESGDATAGTPARITRTDLKTGRIETLADNFEGKRFRALNDITYDSKGRIYFTDKPVPGKAVKNDEVSGGGVYRIDPGGQLTRILGGTETEAPNGIIISPDDKILYLVEANQAEKGSRLIRDFDLKPDGTLANPRVFHNFYPGRSGDGMSIDENGNLYVAAGLHSRRGTSETLDTKPGIHVFSPQGGLLKFISIPEDLVTNCAFGGSDLKTLYVTAGKTVFRIHTEIAGTRR